VQFGAPVLGRAVELVDADHLGLQPPAEDAGAAPCAEAGDGAAAQRSVDVDRPAGDDLGARGRRSGQRGTRFCVSISETVGAKSR
jgi:hypothetical protein